jgi:hypothetical protein
LKRLALQGLPGDSGPEELRRAERLIAQGVKVRPDTGFGNSPLTHHVVSRPASSQGQRCDRTLRFQEVDEV